MTTSLRVADGWQRQPEVRWACLRMLALPRLGWRVMVDGRRSQGHLTEHSHDCATMVCMSAEPSPGIDCIPDERLAAELDRLGVHFVRARALPGGHIPIAPATLLAALACSREARVQLALIPLFLVRPEFASAVGDAAGRLTGLPRLTLACYYTAAMLLQRKHEARLRVFGFGQERLTDIFGQELGVSPSTDVDQSLRLLAQRQAVLSGRSLNWYGTYEHAAERLLRQAELEVRWTPT